MPVIGTQQSPIRIVHDTTVNAKIDSLKFGYGDPLPGHFKADNFVFDIKYKPKPNETEEDTTGKTVSVGGKVTWVIRKIHIHSPAEHTFEDNDAASLECHLLHTLDGDVFGRGPKLVVAVFFNIVPKPTKKGRPRTTLFSLNSAIGDARKATEKKPCTVEHPHNIDVNDFLPDKDQEKLYRYEGSLTSEPFSEDVSWYVLKQHSDVFADNVDQILECAEQEARAVHAIDRRFILRNF